MIGNVKTQPMKASFMYFFQPEYKNIFTDELLVPRSEFLWSGQVSQEEDKKNCINDAKESEVNIFCPFKEFLFQRERDNVELPWSLGEIVLNVVHQCYRVNFIFMLRQKTNKIYEII